MKIGQIELFLKDTLASRDYYESVLGLEVIAVQGPDQVWVRSGESVDSNSRALSISTKA
jgi:hypothetical protein